MAEGETIRVVSAAAGRTGVRAGMSVPEARVYCAELDIREWDMRAITDAVMAVTGHLLQCSPQVTSANGAPGTWWVGASGFDHVGGEEALGELLLHTVRAWHPGARVAIADSCVAARAATWAPESSHSAAKSATLKPATAKPAAARISRGDRGGAERAEHSNGNNNNSNSNIPRKQAHSPVTIVPPGTCAHYLAPAPLGLVPMTEELREALQSLGLRTVGSLAALAPGDIERRWGAEGMGAWRLAHGDDPRRPGLVRMEMARSASAELASATDNMAPLLFLIRSALNRLVQQLLNDGRAAASVSITLSLDARPQHTITREIRPARPLARVAPLFDQCRALLEKWTLEAPVFAVTVSIPATAPLTADQGDLLVPSWRDAAATVDAVFVRLRAALETQGSNDVVVHPTFGNAHRPELAGQWEPADALRLAELGSARDLRRVRARAGTAEMPANAAVIAAVAATATATAGKGLTAEKHGLTAETTTSGNENTTGTAVATATAGKGLTAEKGGLTVETTTSGNEIATGTAVATAIAGKGLTAEKGGLTAEATTTGNATANAITGQGLVVGRGGLAVETGTTNGKTAAITDGMAPTHSVETKAAQPDSVKEVAAALRLLEKPERVVVQLMASIPKQVTWRERRLSFTAAQGPERLSGDWWRRDTFARDYWRCTVAGEGELLMYRDNTGWFLQGWYD
ncbi:MAG: hypothetical protein H7Z40_19080 [Phycisphaerae bacterium]|nr:hypothetical protein [Gemmatimonadaceae bacterium]